MSSGSGSKSAKGSAHAITFHSNYHHRSTGKKGRAILLGKEKGGPYKGCYNMFGGKIDKQDNGWAYKALERELSEEFGSRALANLAKNQHKNDKAGYVHRHGRQVANIFVVKVPSGFSKSQFRPTKEMDDVKWVWVDDLRTARLKNKGYSVCDTDGNQILVSSFARNLTLKLDKKLW